MKPQYSFYDPTVPVTGCPISLKPHPCPFPDYIIDTYQFIVDNLFPDLEYPKILDHMAGIGRIHDLLRCETHSVEIEPEWALSHPQTIIGNATELYFPNSMFDGVFFSPPYANRLADRYEPKSSDESGRKSYVISLGRQASDGSSATKQWGDEYCELSDLTIKEAIRVLKPGGLLAINVKGHYRKGELVDVSGWYEDLIESYGLEYEWGIDLGEEGWVFSPNRDRDTEKVLAFKKGE